MAVSPGTPLVKRAAVKRWQFSSSSYFLLTSKSNNKSQVLYQVNQVQKKSLASG